VQEITSVSYGFRMKGVNTVCWQNVRIVSECEPWWYTYCLLGFKWYMRGLKVKVVPLHAKQIPEPPLEGTGCGQRHAPGRIIPGKKSWVPGPVWMDPDYVVPTVVRTPDRLRYPGCRSGGFTGQRLKMHITGTIRALPVSLPSILELFGSHTNGL
jgi:hypothetical protein